jgi:predicted hydrocarbon binding protein
MKRRIMGEEQKMATNMAIRAAVDGIHEIVGDNGAKILFRNIGFSHIYENPPGYTWEPCISVPDQAKIYGEVINLVGLNGGIGIWRRIGYTNIKYAVEIGHVMDAFKDLPPAEKFLRGMEIFCAASGKGKLVPREDGLADFDCPDCLLCADYKTERVMCGVYEGTTQFMVDFAFGKGKYQVRETKCMAKGDETCYFTLMLK